MQFYIHGSPVLTHTILLARVLALLSLAAILAILSLSISTLVTASLPAPRILLYGLTLASTAILYTLVSIPFFLSPASLSLALMAALDAFLASLFALLGYLLVKPLAPLHCRSLPRLSTPQTEEAWLTALAGHIGRLTLGQWAGQEQRWCYATKAVWGTGMGLCVIYAVSALVLMGLWAKARRAQMGKI